MNKWKERLDRRGDMTDYFDSIRYTLGRQAEDRERYLMGQWETRVIYIAGKNIYEGQAVVQNVKTGLLEPYNQETGNVAACGVYPIVGEPQGTISDAMKEEQPSVTETLQSIGEVMGGGTPTCTCETLINGHHFGCAMKREG